MMNSSDSPDDGDVADETEETDETGETSTGRWSRAKSLLRRKSGDDDSGSEESADVRPETADDDVPLVVATEVPPKDLDIRDLTLDLADGTRVLDEVNLHVTAGTSLAICGPARAGKTTLLRILAGLDDPTEGEVLIGGAVANRLSARDRNLAMVFADYLLHPHLDAYDNLAFSALLRRDQPEEQIDQLVEEVAELLALTTFLDERPSRLDESQRQRVALGRALVRDAQGYLFDDPFAAQDPRIRGHVRSVTAQWQRDLGRTSIFTTRTPEEALTLSDRVAVMNLGWIHQVGTPQELYDKPADLFVAGFMGNPVMNLVPGEPDGMSIKLPFAQVPISYEMSQKVSGMPIVVVGMRPEHCFDASLPEASAVENPVRFTARVDDIEYGGKTQRVFLGYEIDPKIEDQLTAVEDDFEFDLFQNFFVAQLAGASPAEEGSEVSVVVSANALHFFDLETAEAI